MQRKKVSAIILLGVSCIVCAAIVIGGAAIWYRVRPQPAEKNEVIFQGITYQRDVRQSPRPMVIHKVTIVLNEPGISFLVTPGDPQAVLPLKARTTSRFLDNFGLQLAVNGDAFMPWHSNGVLDYYPHSGDPVEPVGIGASRGEVYSLQTDDEPVLYISRTNQVQFNQPPGKIYNAISGNLMLVERGKALKGLDDVPQPRTAIGIDKNRRHMIIVVIDGRQPGYSEGATLRELAEMMVEFGAFSAMNLDGGGSSTLVKEGVLHAPDLLNSPIEHQIPGRQRVIGNHLGVYAKPAVGD